MIEMLDHYYNWSQSSIDRIAKRLISGGVLTMNYSKKEAWINLYVGKDHEQISWDYAKLITILGFLELESGNLETSEEHYYFNYKK